MKAVRAGLLALVALIVDDRVLAGGALASMLLAYLLQRGGWLTDSPVAGWMLVLLLGATLRVSAGIAVKDAGRDRDARNRGGAQA